ncbi:MAG: alpha-L-fucosidase [Verrucomicrobia bacterium]|nr:alpha-L-fucosidase [Verrucomicrobiota bacterium]
MNPRQVARLLSNAVIGALTLGLTLSALAANRPERVEWFRDLGFGLFIHWSVDSQLGIVISHSLVGASPDYTERFFRLRDTFDPQDFQPQRWARLAKLAGMNYLVFTTKHHSGFCLFETRTTDFNILRTPYGRDITRALVEAFRREGLAIGFYFSPDDFHFLHRQGLAISRDAPHANPTNNPALMRHNQAQLRELLTQYGRIDVLFLDGEPAGLKELAWELQPDIVVTRGEMKTPEERLPGQPLPGAWEACFPMGTQWHYKPTNERYRSGKQLIEMLIETRAKGGNLLLNIGPTPDGIIPPEQEARLREIAAWMFINREAIHGTRPWVVTTEEQVNRDTEVWFTQARDGSAVYALVAGAPWPWGTRREFVFASMKATERTEVSVLGESGTELEYRPEVNPRPHWRNTPQGLHVSALRTKRVYNDYDWPNAVVLKLTHVESTKNSP